MQFVLSDSIVEVLFESSVETWQNGSRNQALMRGRFYEKKKEYYVAINRNELLIYTTAWLDLRDYAEWKKTQNIIYSMIPFV